MMWRGKMVVFGALLLTGCTYPERTAGRGTGEGDTSHSMVSVEFLKSHYRGYPYTFTENYRIRGCVVSTDRSGNYYKTLSVADDTGAVELKIDRERLFEKYPMGSLLEVECNGLTVGSYGGVLQMGTAPIPDYETGYIAEGDLDAFIHITGRTEEAVEPVKRTIEALTVADVGRLAVFDYVQFREDGDTVTWCNEDADDPSGFRDTDRELTDAKGHTLRVRTSRRADFASWTLPVGSGSAEGIVSVYNGEFQLRVIRPELLYSSMADERF